MTESPDYERVEIRDVPTSEYTQTERRAYIYRRLIAAGHHTRLNKTELAETLDVSRPTIYGDLDAIAEQIEERLGVHHKSETVAVFQKCIKELIDEGEWEKAAKTQNMMSEWLEKRGKLSKEPERHEISWRDFVEAGQDE